MRNQGQNKVSALRVHAANGINLIGFGNESSLMAGADVALSRDTGSLSTNPAGMLQTHGKAFDLHEEVVYAPDTGHKDGVGNDTTTSRRVFFGGDFGYISHRRGSKLAWGIGLLAQGGTGSVYDEINTPFGTRDKLSALTRVAKLTPGVGYQVNGKLSVGASIPIFYADSEQKIFPNTSTATFFGLDLKGAHTVSPGFKAGMQYRWSRDSC